MTIRELIQQPHVWMTAGQESATVVSSRVRLARNLAGAAFPGWAGELECYRVWRQLNGLLAELPTLRPLVATGMEELSDLERGLLFERHLISGEQAGKGRGSGVALREDESLSLMVNEEDHLRMQALLPGLSLRECWRRINAVDTELEGRVTYAFAPDWGYLTACPSNIGTGIRASVMLHLPGLTLMNELEPIMKGIQKIGLAVRGLWGEGTEANGNMLQVSNQITLGETEDQIVAHLEQIALEIVEYERSARERLLEKREAVLRDHVGRAVGILTQAHLLSSKEALDWLSGLRLGIDMELIRNLDRQVVDELFLLIQPAHLQWREGRRLKPAERDAARATLVRERLKSAMKRRPRSTNNE